MDNKTINKIKKKLNEIQKYKEFFTFYPEINTINDYLKNENQEVSITHKKCGKKENIILSDWIKKGPVRANRLLFFKSDNINLTCNHCASIELQNKLDHIYNKEIKLVSEFVNTKTLLTVQHTCDNKTFSISYNLLMSGRIICKICGKRFGRDINFKNNWLKKKLIEKDILNIKPIDDYFEYNEEMNFECLDCGETFKASTFNLLRRKNKCPNCAEKLAKEMDILIDDNFELISIDESKITINVKCLKCNKEFTDYKRKLDHNKIVCPHCTPTRNNFISSKEKLASYNKKFEGRFKILESFTTTKDKVKIKRLSCGHIIKRSINDISRKNYKDVCPECKRLERVSKLNQKLEAKYKGRYMALNALEKYQKNTSAITFLDTYCNKTFVNSYSNLLNSKYFNCPNCNSSDLTSKIKAEVFNKYKGEYIVLTEYINSTTPIKFRHKQCGHTFHKTKGKFFSAKIPCNNCAKKSRSLGIKQAQINVNKKFGNLFTIKGKYINNHTKLLVVCNKCNAIKEHSLTTLLNKKGCVECKTKFL